MKILKIADLSMVLNTVTAIGKVVEGANFVINGEGLTCLFKANNSRVKLTSNAIIATDEDINFCINDFSKFVNFLKLIKSTENVNTVTIKIKRNALVFDGNSMNFKYNTCRPEIIADFVDVELKAELVPVCRFESDFDTIKTLIQNKNLISDELVSIIYRLQQDEVKTKMVYATLSDLGSPASNTLRLFCGNIIKGQLTEEIFLNAERLQFATILQSDNIVFERMDKNVLAINLEEEKDDLKTEIKIYLSLLKNPSLC